MNKDIERLKDNILTQAKYYLSAAGEFYPFGAGAFQIVVLDWSKPCLRENLKDYQSNMRQFEMHPLGQ
ncbi:MAG: hypothetical protein V4714_11675 [Bacteroidota bacterium]